MSVSNKLFVWCLPIVHISAPCNMTHCTSILKVNVLILFKYFYFTKCSMSFNFLLHLIFSQFHDFSTDACEVVTLPLCHSGRHYSVITDSVLIYLINITYCENKYRNAAANIGGPRHILFSSP